MLTLYQKRNFEKNRKVYEYLEEAIKILTETTSDKEIIIDFLNIIESTKINIISEISDEFCEKLPEEWIISLIIDIVQNEKEVIKRVFLCENGINLNNEVDSIKRFIVELNKYYVHLQCYDYSLISLYAKHVGII